MDQNLHFLFYFVIWYSKHTEPHGSLAWIVVFSRQNLMTPPVTVIPTHPGRASRPSLLMMITMTVTMVASVVTQVTRKVCPVVMTRMFQNHQTQAHSRRNPQQIQMLTVVSISEVHLPHCLCYVYPILFSFCKVSGVR